MARISPVLCIAVFAGGMAFAGASEDTALAEQALRRGDLIAAMSLLRKAADEGHAPAQSRLADLLDAAEQDAEAVALYRKAAEQGEPAGQYGYGRMLARGEGVTRDVAQGLQWIRRAADARHAPALEALARAHRSGDLGLARDAAEAQRLEQLARSMRVAPQAASR